MLDFADLYLRLLKTGQIEIYLAFLLKRKQKMEHDKNLSVEEFVSKQIEKWKKARLDNKKQRTIITIAIEPGSGGTIIGEIIAEKLGLDYFHHNLIKEIAQSSKVADKVLQSLEKERLNGVKDLIASVVDKYYLWPGLYLNHLIEVITTIGKHGNAVIIGRGGNFILPAEKRFAVRVVAPLETRIKNVVKKEKSRYEDTKRRIIKRESRRRAFVRESFHEKISDPLNYDVVVNTEAMSFESAANIIVAAALSKFDITGQ